MCEEFVLLFVRGWIDDFNLILNPIGHMAHYSVESGSQKGAFFLSGSLQGLQSETVDDLCSETGALFTSIMRLTKDVGVFNRYQQIRIQLLNNGSFENSGLTFSLTA